MSSSLLPPRLRDWTEGHPQIGVFLRTAEGATLQMVHDQATENETAFVLALLGGLGRLPDAVLDQVRTELERLHKKANGKSEVL